MSDHESWGGWYVVLTRPHYEARVVEALGHVRVTSYLPMSKHLARHARKTSTVERPLIPRHLFAWIEDRIDYHTIKNTEGVTGFLKARLGERRLLRVPNSEVQLVHLFETMGEFDITPETTNLAIGQAVKAVAGKWQDYMLVLEEIKADNRANVSMALFRGAASKPFEVDIRHLRAA